MTPLFSAPQSTARADAQLLVLLAGIEQSRAVSLEQWIEGESQPDVVAELTSRLARTTSADNAIMNRLATLGVNIADAVPVATELLADFRSRLVARTWWEYAIVHVIGYRFLDDFITVLAEGAGRRVQNLVNEVILPDDGVAAVVERVVSSADSGAHGENTEQLRSLMALWGRRVVGESVVTVEQWMAGFEDLSERIIQVATARAGVEGPPSQPEKWILSHLTGEHTRRMSTMDLAA